MPPKGRQRQRRIANESDYDTDVTQNDATYTQGTEAAVATVAVPLRSNDELNLSVLRRHYPDVNQVLSVAPFAVVYAFSPESQSWEKTGVEGTMFVCQLIPVPVGEHVIERYTVVVFNRKGLNNYMAELRSSNGVEITDEYVILQSTDENTNTDTVSGLWIFSEPEPSSTVKAREINAQIIAECASRAEKSRELVTHLSNHSASPGNGQGQYQADQDHSDPSQGPRHDQYHAHGAHNHAQSSLLQHSNDYSHQAPLSQYMQTHVRYPESMPNTNATQNAPYTQQQNPPQPQQFPQPQTMNPGPHGPHQPEYQVYPNAANPSMHNYSQASKMQPPLSQPNVLLGLFQNAQRG